MTRAAENQSADGTATRSSPSILTTRPLTRHRRDKDLLESLTEHLRYSAVHPVPSCSMQTSTSCPRKALANDSRLVRPMFSRSFARARLTAGATTPFIVAAGVPGRSEYGNTCRFANGCRMMKSCVAAKSSSVSPGKPVMKSAPSARRGPRIRVAALQKRSTASIESGRFICFSTAFDPDWTER